MLLPVGERQYYFLERESIMGGFPELDVAPIVVRKGNSLTCITGFI
jgi:hypothetical protein